MSIWNNVDEYFKLVHSTFCSSLCPCYIEHYEEQFLHNYFTKKFYEHKEEGWININEDNKHMTMYQRCPQDIKDGVVKLYNSNPNNTNAAVIKPEMLNKYWKRIEEKFECTGWCETKYVNVYTLQEETMTKYAFSDVQKGVVKYPGCLNRIIHWLPMLISAIGGCLIVVGVLQGITVVFVVMIIKENKKAKKIINYNNNTNNDHSDIIKDNEDENVVTVIKNDSKHNDSNLNDSSDNNTEEIEIELHRRRKT